MSERARFASKEAEAAYEVQLARDLLLQALAKRGIDMMPVQESAWVGQQCAMIARATVEAICRDVPLGEE